MNCNEQDLKKLKAGIESMCRIRMSVVVDWIRNGWSVPMPRAARFGGIWGRLVDQ